MSIAVLILVCAGLAAAGYLVSGHARLMLAWTVVFLPLNGWFAVSQDHAWFSVVMVGLLGWQLNDDWRRFRAERQARRRATYVQNFTYVGPLGSDVRRG